MFTAGIVT